MSTVDVDPSTLFGGTWERIKDKFLLTAGDNYAAGSTGGSTSHTHTNPSTGSTAITVAQIPSHSHTRGSMDITGQFFARPGESSTAGWGGSIPNGASGAFGMTVRGSGYNHNAYLQSSYMNPADLITFKASRTWSGSTSSVGSGQGHTHSIPSHSHSMNHSHTVGNTGSSSNMPPYLTVYCWRRTA